MMTMTRQKEDFSDGAIDVYHDLCLELMGKYVDLAGTENVTNYIHLIGSGHLVYYLKHFRNLYKFSQQGWEALNAKVRRVYFSRTQRGGNVGGKAKLKHGHVRPLFLFFSRYTMWKTGHGDQFFATEQPLVATDAG
jgi:hypothetical protein